MPNLGAACGYLAADCPRGGVESRAVEED